jgi:hypothetical protein
VKEVASLQLPLHLGAGVDEDGAVTSRIDSWALDCSDPDLVASFWTEVLGWPVTERGWQRTPNGPNGISIGDGVQQIDFRWTDDERRVGKNRWHLDVIASNRSQDDELARLIGLGAVEVDIGQGDADWMTWHVLADPEGNVFCLVRGDGELTQPDG